jgi:hypothetical protein
LNCDSQRGLQGVEMIVGLSPRSRDAHHVFPDAHALTQDLPGLL